MKRNEICLYNGDYVEDYHNEFSRIKLKDIFKEFLNLSNLKRHEKSIHNDIKQIWYFKNTYFQKHYDEKRFKEMFGIEIMDLYQVVKISKSRIVVRKDFLDNFFSERGRYYGEFLNDKKHGQGVYYFKNGGRYKGEYINGIREGKGIFCFKGKNKRILMYEGEFKNDQINGIGVCYYHDGNRYEGEFKNGMIRGKGVYYCNSGNRYVGEFNNNTFEKGIISYYNYKTYKNLGAEVEERYEGDFKNCKKDGEGVYYFANGDEYHGGFKNDKIEGKGFLSFRNINGKNNRFLYESIFENGKIKGKGLSYYLDGRICFGNYYQNEEILDKNDIRQDELYKFLLKLKLDKYTLYFYINNIKYTELHLLADKFHISKIITDEKDQNIFINHFRKDFLLGEDVTAFQEEDNSPLFDGNIIGIDQPNNQIDIIISDNSSTKFDQYLSDKRYVEGNTKTWNIKNVRKRKRNDCDEDELQPEKKRVLNSLY